MVKHNINSMDFKNKQQHYKGGTADVFNIRLPITQRGLFFQDQFFQQARSHFEAAVKDVLSKWDNHFDDPFPSSTKSPFGEEDPFLCGSLLKDSLLPGNLQRYRQLRAQNLNKESQAVTAFEDQHSYKVILDVRDFLHGDMKVTVKGEREVVVEGAPSRGRQGFSHKFLMPQGVLIDQTTSVLSSDGVLTIITPKIMQPVKEKVRVPIEIKGNVTKLQGKDRQKALAASLLKKNIQCKINKQVIEDFKTKVKEEQPSPCSENSDNNNKSIAENHVTNKPFSVFENDLKQGFKPIIRRGNFFSDSIFQDNHTQFNNSVKRAVETSEQKNMDPMVTYRHMRSHNNENSNRAISVTDGPKMYKITIDVREFAKDGELTVKVVHEKDLLVEGHLGPLDPGKSFAQNFSLPQHVDINSISSVLSADGVLVITGSHMNASESLASHNVPRADNSLNNQSSTYASSVDLLTPDSSTGSSMTQGSFSSIPTPDSLPPLSTLLSGATTPRPFSFPNSAAQMISPSSSPSPMCLNSSSPVPPPPLSPAPTYKSYSELKIRPCSSDSSEPNTPSSITCSTPSTVILYKLDDNPGDMVEEEDMEDDSQACFSC